MRKAALVVGIVVAIAAAVAGLAARGRRVSAPTAYRGLSTAEVGPADFAITLPVEGALEASRSVAIVNSARETQIVWVMPDGVPVKAGDVVMRLNPAELRKNFDRLQNEVAQAEEKVKQDRAQSERQVENARSSLAKAEEGMRLALTEAQAGVEKAESEVTFLTKEVEVAQGELDKRRRLLAERLMPVTEVESAEDELRNKQFSLEAARRSLERSRVDAETNKRLRQMDVETAKLTREQAEGNLESTVAVAQRDLAQKQSDLQEAQEQLDGTEVKAAVDGMLLLGQTWEDGWRALRIGDRVWEGQKIANIIDPKDMLLRCDINEADIELVKVGQEAEVRVPAIGSQVLRGKVQSVDNLARQRNPWEGGLPGRKVFASVIKLTSNNPKLRPGMGGSVEIVLERVRRGLAVPLESLFLQGGGYLTYVVDDHGCREVPVKVLNRNNALAAVEGKLKAGDRVSLARPPAEAMITGARDRVR